MPRAASSAADAHGNGRPLQPPSFAPRLGALHPAVMQKQKNPDNNPVAKLPKKEEVA
jgi:hypothetical protein